MINLDSHESFMSNVMTIGTMEITDKYRFFCICLCIYFNSAISFTPQSGFTRLNLTNVDAAEALSGFRYNCSILMYINPEYSEIIDKSKCYKVCLMLDKQKG